MAAPKKDSADYHLAPAGRRYKGKLEQLLGVLRKEAIEDKGTWTYKVLPRGALISYMVRPEDMRVQVRIARRPTENFNELRLEKWEFEISVFLDKFKLEELDGATQPCRFPGKQLYRITLPTVANNTNAQFIALRLGELRPGLALCHKCGEETPWWPLGGVEGQRCNKCVNGETKAQQEKPHA